jgi:hypothetical protein
MNVEEVESFLPDIQKASLEATVQRLVNMRRENGRSQRCTYNNARESLAAVGVDMSISALYMRVTRECSMDRDKARPTTEVEIPQEDSEISSLSLSSKAGRPKGTSDTKKREDDLKYKDCVNSIATNYADLQGL